MAVTKLKRSTECSEAEWETRCHLAALYRILHKLRMTDLIYTHMSARVPGEPGHFLINRYGEFFDEVTASSLVKMDFDGNVVGEPGHYNDAGFIIHSAVLMARPDVNCVMHLHTRSSVAVSAQACGLRPISQQSLLVLGSIGYHDYDVAAGNHDERETLGRDCAKADNIILRNHGLLTVGTSIQAAFKNMYYLETACQIQTAAGDGELIEVPEPVRSKAIERYKAWSEEPNYGDLEWESMLRMLDRDGADYQR
ncbi:MAG: class II aldolase/adducin family protein [Alphaproteobacteria bacterium]|nr:class II aldolase/adducin family protein [Alphaproteobacteria bacterium]